MSASRPIVLFALQSPALLKLLANTLAWDLRIEPMGDHEGLAESAELAQGKRIPRLNGDVPDVIVVCSPAQLVSAKEMVFGFGKDIPIVWAVHNGYETGLTDGYEGPILCFSQNNLSTHTLANREHAYVIRPHVPQREQKTIGSLGTQNLFTMQNRPSTRMALAAQMRAALLRDVTLGCDIPLDVYGQGQDKGFLSPGDRDLRFVTSRGYASCLPTNAGFGLAEHEALATGCPLVAMAWGDTQTTLAGYRGLCHSAEELAATVRFLASLPPRDFVDTRRFWSEMAADLLATHYTQAIMDAGIRAMLGALLV